MKIERCEELGAWHHVMNRGLAQRTVIENKEDARFFLAQMAKAVSRGLVEVHVFCLMTTHFHMLVRSPRAELSEAMRQIQNAYVRWFNRTRRRDGPLFRGRFCSRRIRSQAHWANVVRYIDENAKQARIVGESARYPYSSRHYYSRQKGPPWLNREEIEREVCERERLQIYSPEFYDQAWSRIAFEPELVERRLGKARLASDALDDLVGSAPAAVLDWMCAQAQLADGTKPGSPVTSSTHVMACIDVQECAEPSWRIRSNSQLRRGWPILRAGLLRSAAGLLHREIASLLNCSESAAARMVAVHVQLLSRGGDYQERVRNALGAVHPVLAGGRPVSDR